MTEKPSPVTYSYAQQPSNAAPAGGNVSYPSIPASSQQQQQQQSAQPPPPQQQQHAFAVGTPAYYPQQQPQQQYPYQQQQQYYCCSEACFSLPQMWLFAFGWIFPFLWIVAAFFPLCVPLQNGERGWWIANLTMSIISFTVALVVAIMVPTMAVVHGSGDGGMGSTTYVYRG